MHGDFKKTIVMRISGIRTSFNGLGPNSQSFGLKACGFESKSQ